MEMIIIAAIGFVIAILLRRKDAFQLHFQWSGHTTIAVLASILIFIFSLSLLLLKADSTSWFIVKYIIMYIAIGTLIPFFFASHHGFSEIGITKRNLKVSFSINIGLGLLFGLLLLAEGTWEQRNWLEFSQGTFALFVGGLFEILFYYGFVHLRLQKALGMIPAILFTSLLYVLWHVGDQFVHEPDFVDAVVKMFFVGVFYQSIFSITRNVATIWPFFFGSGVLLDYAVNINAMNSIADEVHWAMVSLGLMFIAGLYFSLKRIRNKSELIQNSAKEKDNILYHG